MLILFGSLHFHLFIGISELFLLKCISQQDTFLTVRIIYSCLIKIFWCEIFKGHDEYLVEEQINLLIPLEYTGYTVAKS